MITNRIKRGANASLPNGAAGEPLFTTDTYDLYIGKGDGTNQRYQKYMADAINGTGVANQLAYFSGANTIAGSTFLTLNLTADNGYLILTGGSTYKNADIWLNRYSNAWENAIRFQTNGTTDWYVGSSATGSNSDFEIYNYGTSANGIKIAKATNNVTVGGTLTATIGALATAATNFVTSDSGTLKSRTASEVLSDIGAQAISEKGQNNGYASLDAGGKVPVTQLPNSIMEYKGNWNASTNTPTLADGTGNAGDVYLCNVAGTVDLGSGNITFAVGDWCVYNGTIWQKSINSNAVVSVNGQTGVVSITLDSISPMTTLGDIIYGGASGTATRLAGNTTTTRKFLRQTGTGSVSAAPAWDTLVAGDIPALAYLSNSTTSTQSGYFGDIFLYDDSTPSHYLGITNSANLTAARTLSINVNDANRTISLSGNLTVSSAATISGTNSGDQTITLTGDVTGSGTGSFATTIGALKVTNAMLAGSIEASKLIGTDIATVGTITAGTWNGSTIAIAYGGTGATTKAAAFDALSPMTTLGDITYGGASGTGTRLAGNTTTTKQYLSQTGNGTASAAPAWATIAGSDITGAALTKVDDTNVTLTLGGTPTTALLRAASLTLGWTGLLAVSRGGTGVSTANANTVFAGPTTGAAAAPTFRALVAADIPALSYIDGSGTTNTLPKFTGATTLGNSNVTDSGTLITLGSNSYVNGSLGIGSTSLTGYTLRLAKSVTGATTAYAIRNTGVIESDVTSSAFGVSNTLQTVAAAFTLGNYYHFAAGQSTIGAGSALTNQYGYFVDSTLTGATNNFGFYGNIAAGTNRWNLYMNGTANNYLAGSLGIGTTSVTGFRLIVGGAITGSATSYGVYSFGTIQSDVTSSAYMYRATPSTAAASFNVGNIYGYLSSAGSLGAGSSVTNHYGFYADALSIGTNNYGYYGAVASGTNRWNLFMIGTANNYMAGSLGIGQTQNFVSSGPILTTTLTNGGSGYVDGTYTDVASTNITAAGNSALYTIVVSGGVVTSATLTWGGMSYRANDTVTISNTLLGGTGSGLIITINTVDSSQLTIANANGGDISLFRDDTGLATGENLGTIKWLSNDTSVKASGIEAKISAFGAGSSGGAYLSFFTSTGAGGALNEAVRIGSGGQVGIGTGSFTGYNLRVSKNITGAVNSYGIASDGEIQSGVTTSVINFRSFPSTAAASFTLTDLIHFNANQSTIGAGSTVTTQYGFNVSSTLTGATNNYGFFGNIASGTGRWNLYMNGTAANYLAGNLSIGTTTSNGRLTIQPTNDTVGISVSGSSLTGTNAQSLLDLSQTWNTTGYPTAIKLNITNTASGILSNLMDLQVGGTSEFKVDKDGNTTIAGNTTSSSFIKSGGTAAQILAADGTVITAGTNITISGGSISAADIGFANPMTTLGDIIYGAASGTATRLAGNTVNGRRFLRQTGTGTVSAAPVWDSLVAADIPASALTKTDDTNVTLTLGGTPASSLLAAVSLTLGWAGQLAISRGGTGASTAVAAFDNLSPLTTLGDTLYHNGTDNVRLAGNTTTTKQYLSQTGTGTVSAAPSWSTIAGSDITGAALTKTDDTNVTLTLGGTPATSLLRAASITVGWTGQLSVARGGTGAASFTAGQILYGNGTSAIASSATFTYTPTSALLVNNSVTAASAIARGVNITSTLVAAANNDALVGVRIAPTFTNGAFTGVTNTSLSVVGNSNFKDNISLEASNSTNKWLLYNYTDNTLRFNYNGAGNDEFILDTSGNVTYLGSVTATSGTFSGNLVAGNGGSASEYHLTIGQGRTGNGFAYVDLVGDATYTDYGFRMIRGNGGANTFSALIHRGTGELQLSTEDAAPMTFRTSAVERARIVAGGDFVIGNGDTSATPSTGVIRGTNGSGTNIAGAEFRIVGGVGTGTGAGGAITFYTAAAGASGATLNTATEKMRISATGVVRLNTYTTNGLVYTQNGDGSLNSAARTINGTTFDGSANITTANWGTSRTITIGLTGKSVNGSANVSWTIAEIGALALTGGTLTGALTGTTATFASAQGTTGTLLTLQNTTAFAAGNIVPIRFFSGNSFGGLEQTAAIWAINPNAASNNGGDLVFATSTNGTGTTPTEKFRIANDGVSTFTNQIIASSTEGATSAIFRNTGVQNSNGIELRGGTAGTSVNWKIEKDNTVSNSFQITPSTTNGGTTYTIPVFTIASTGAATFSSAVTTGGNINIPNGSYYRANRSTGSATISCLGFASGSDTLSITGGTSGAVTSIKFADTGGDIAGFYDGNFGVGTITPSGAKLVVYGSAAAASNVTLLNLANGSDGGVKLNFSNSVAAELASIVAGVTGTGAGTDDGVLIFNTSANAVASERMRIASNGQVNITNSNATTALAIRNTSTAATTSKSSAIYFEGTDTVSTGKNSGTIEVVPSDSNYIDTDMLFYTRTADTVSEKVRINNKGVVGIRIVPNTGWGTSLAALQIGTGGTIVNWTGGNSNLSVGVNFYDDGAGAQKRIYATAASKFECNADVITFSNAESSTADSTITWSPRMSIQSSGEIWMGYTTDQGAYLLQVNGSVLASSFFESSDIRLKDVLTNSYSENFSAIEFMWKDKRDYKKHWGYAAQDVMKYIPDAIQVNNDGMMTVNYNEAHTWKIAQLEAKIVELEAKLK